MRAWMIMGLLWWPGPTTAAEDTASLDRVRVRQGVWAGPSVARGMLAFSAPSATIETRLDAVPALSLGGDLWATPAMGLYAAARIGLGADVTEPASGARIAYNLHQLEAGARGRWHLNPRPDALALVGGVGLRGAIQTVQVQRPSFLVDRSAFGPELRAGLAWPLAGWRLWLRAEATAGMPFFVREGPTDSGDPQRALAYGGRVLTVVGLSGRWSAQLLVDWRAVDLDFAGEGTRTGGVVDGQTRDRLLTLDLALRYGL